MNERNNEQWRNHLLRAASLHLPVPFLGEITRSPKLYNAHSYIAAQKYYLKMILYSKEQVDCESKSKREREAFAAHNEGESGCMYVFVFLDVFLPILLLLLPNNTINQIYNRLSPSYQCETCTTVGIETEVYKRQR